VGVGLLWHETAEHGEIQSARRRNQVAHRRGREVFALQIEDEVRVQQREPAYISGESPDLGEDCRVIGGEAERMQEYGFVVEINEPLELQGGLEIKTVALKFSKRQAWIVEGYQCSSAAVP